MTTLRVPRPVRTGVPNQTPWMGLIADFSLLWRKSQTFVVMGSPVAGGAGTSAVRHAGPAVGRLVMARTRGRCTVAQHATGGRTNSLRRALIPLALAQFICSFAGSNMNVMINDISKDLDTTVQGVQVAITIFLLVMAALMIPGGKLTDKYGRKRCFMVGLAVYGVGALLSAAAPGLGVLILGNSLLEGVGTALLIPPVYILTTLLFTDLPSRARAFGAISAMGGIGAAAGPLIGGLITSAISWRAAFVFQALVVGAIIWLARDLRDPLPADPHRAFDIGGAILSALGLVLVVTGILAADNNAWLMIALIVAGALVLFWFFRSVGARERAGKEPLLSTSLFHNRASNLGLVTQNTQWLLLTGVSFVVAAYLQVMRGYDAIETGLIFTAETLGLLAASLAAERLAKRRAQRTLILGGFLVTIGGIGVLLAMVTGSPSVWAFAPGLLLIGRKHSVIPSAELSRRDPLCQGSGCAMSPPVVIGGLATASCQAGWRCRSWSRPPSRSVGRLGAGPA